MSEELPECADKKRYETNIHYRKIIQEMIKDKKEIMELKQKVKELEEARTRTFKLPKSWIIEKDEEHMPPSFDLLADKIHEAHMKQAEQEEQELKDKIKQLFYAKIDVWDIRGRDSIASLAEDLVEGLEKELRMNFKQFNKKENEKE